MKKRMTATLLALVLLAGLLPIPQAGAASDDPINFSGITLTNPDVTEVLWSSQGVFNSTDHSTWSPSFAYQGIVEDVKGVKNMAKFTDTHTYDNTSYSKADDYNYYWGLAFGDKNASRAKEQKFYFNLPVSTNMTVGSSFSINGGFQFALGYQGYYNGAERTEQFSAAQVALQLLVNGNLVYQQIASESTDDYVKFFYVDYTKRLTEPVESIQLVFNVFQFGKTTHMAFWDREQTETQVYHTNIYVKHDGVYSAQPATHANWTAEYYLQNVDGTGYYLEDSVVTDGAVGRSITIPNKSYTGFDKTATGSITTGTVTEAGTVLKQYYNRKRYTLTVGGSSSTVLWGKTVYQPVSPTKAGYTFTGWQSGSSYVTFPLTVTSNLTLTPAYIPNATTVYKVEHYLQQTSGSYSLHEAQALFGTTDTTATAVAKDYTGYHENTTHASRKASGTIAGSGTLVLKLYYDLEKYTATFYSNGGTAVPAQANIRYGQKVTQPTAPTRSGYDFGGWFSNTACTVPYSFSAAVGGNVNLYAQWIPRDDTTYKVQHYKQSYSNLSQYVLTDTDTLESTTGVYVNAAKAVRAYEGYHQNMTHASRVVTAQLAGDGSTTLRLYYDVDQCRVSWQTGGGTGVSVRTVLYGNTVTKPDDPTRTYYRFAGWYTDAALEHSYDFALPVTSDMTLYAKWEPAVAYKLEYYRQTVALDGYDLYDSTTLYGLPGEAVSIPPREFYGFQAAHPTGEKLSGSISADGSLVLCAYYDRIVPHISIGGTESDLAYGKEIAEPTPDPKPGYTFIGWEDSSGNPVTFPLTVGEDNLDIHPVYTAREDTPYTVQTWLEEETEGSYALKKETHLSGITDDTAAHDRADYRGYELVEDMSTLSGRIDPEEELVLKAYYRRREYKISVGGINQWARYGLTATRPSQPVRHGYVFEGYTINSGRYVDADGNTYSNGSLWNWNTKVCGDVELLENWVPDTHVEYKVDHFVQDTSQDEHRYPDLWKSETCYGETDTIVTAAYNSFYGFTPNPAYGLTHSHASLAGDGSTELRLYYTRNSFPVTVLDRDGSVLIDTQMAYEATLSQPVIDETKAGYDWTGWKDSEGHDITWPHKITAAITVHPTWRVRTDTPYNVEIWAEATDGSGYKLVQTIQETYTTDLTVDYRSALTGMTGYHLNDEVSTLVGMVAAEGDGYPLTLSAYYDRDPITVTIGGEEKEVKYGDIIPEPDTPQKDGYDFLGWFDDTTGEKIDWPLTVENADRAIHPEYGAREDTVYHVHHYEQDIYDDDYTLVDTHTLYGVTDTLASVVYDCDNHFHHVDEAHQVLSGTIAGDGSLMLEAYYDRNLYDVTVDGVTGTYRYQYEVSEPTEPVKSGYHFTGWSSDAYPGAEHIFPLEVLQTVEIQSTWEADPDTQYRVEHYWQTLVKQSYELYESELLSGETDSTVSAQAKTYTGLTLTDTQDSVTSGIISADTMLVLRLYYDRNTVKVVMGGEEQEVAAGTPIDRPPDPDPVEYDKPGYDFGGWVDGDGNPIPWPIESYENVDIYPVWIPKAGISYTVEYYWAEIADPAVYTLHDTQAHTGHTDEVVSAAVDCYPKMHLAHHEGNILTATVAHDGSTVLRVYLDRDTLTVTLPDGTVLEVPYGATIDEPVPPDNPGYTLIHWDKPDGTPAEFPLDILEGLTLTPHWQAAINTPYTVEHWYWQSEDTGFVLVETEYLTGTTESEVSAHIREPEERGWTFDTDNPDNLLCGVILGDGSLVLRAYYKRLPPPTDTGNGGNTGSGGNGGKKKPVTQTPVQPEAPVASETPTAPSEGVTDGDGGAPGSWTSPFQDVPAGSWYADAVQDAYAKGITLGVGGGDFAPSLSATRGMIVTFLWRMAGKPIVDCALTFSDVPDNTWYTQAVRWAASEGIIQGYTKYTFRPDDVATREQVATILYRYCKGAGADEALTSYADAGEVSPWAAHAMRWACTIGLIQGKGDGCLHPKDGMTRAEAVTVLCRMADGEKRTSI